MSQSFTGVNEAAWGAPAANHHCGPALAPSRGGDEQDRAESVPHGNVEGAFQGSEWIAGQ